MAINDAVVTGSWSHFWS